MNKARNIIVIVIALLSVFVILQNTQTVETRLLFVTISMPRALLLIVTFLVGFAVGVILTGHWRRRLEKAAP